MSICKVTDTAGAYLGSCEFDPPLRLSELLDRSGIPFELPCGGKRRCLKCLVSVSGSLSFPDKHEASLLRGREPHTRYACMTEALGDVTIVLPKVRRESIQTEGALPSFVLDPISQGYGVSIDIGTTTIASYLCRLSDGERLVSEARHNPQAVFGADVISRMERSISGDREALATSVRQALSDLIGTLSRRAGIGSNDIRAVVITGNTAMLYLLTARDPSCLTTVPFKPDCLFGFDVPAEMLSLPCSAEARVYLMHSISAYVGSDITSAALASGLFLHGSPIREDAPVLLADIGTNGEMMLNTGTKLYCCSTAAGPAFEGAGISMGMAAHAGAICSCRFNGSGFDIKTVEDAPAAGLCGSGIVDVIASMLDAGIIDNTGYLNEDGHAFEECIFENEDGETAFMLPGTDVSVTAKDIRAVQLAKAAICAGMLALLKAAKLDPEEIRELRIAGGFGSKINVDSAERIGLIPEGFASRSKSVGNAAGAGAVLVLLSKAMLAESELLALSAETLELSTDPYFMEQYVEQMMFGEE